MNKVIDWLRFSNKNGATSDKVELSREIAAALVVKFCLLGLVWWAFFAGRKIVVDDGSIARRLLDESAVTAPLNR